MSSVLWRHNFWTFAQRPVSEGVLGIIVCLYNPRGVVVTKCTAYCHLTYCLLSPDLLLTVTDLLLTVTDALLTVTVLLLTVTVLLLTVTDALLTVTDALLTVT